MTFEMQRLLLVTGLGLALGSFLNVVISRLPDGWGAFFSSARSHCPACSMAIRWYDNVPLISFLLLRGRCRHCQQAISWHYPLVEASMALVSLLLYLQLGLSVYFYKYLSLMMVLLAAAIIDLRSRTIPDALLLVGLAAGLYFSFAAPYPGWQQSLISLAVGLTLPLLVVCLYEIARGKEMFGGGDIKLLALISLYIGWQRLGTLIIYSCLLAALLIMLRRGLGNREPLPFAPAMAAGTGLLLWNPSCLTFLPF